MKQKISLLVLGCFLLVSAPLFSDTGKTSCPSCKSEITNSNPEEGLLAQYGICSNGPLITDYCFATWDCIDGGPGCTDEVHCIQGKGTCQFTVNPEEY